MRRILVEIFAPAYLGAAVFLVSTAMSEGGGFVHMEKLLPATLFFMIPALALTVPYMFVMEFAFAQGMRPGSSQSLLLSIFIGSSCGFFVWGLQHGFTFGEGQAAQNVSVALPSAAMGALVGFVTWTLVRRCPRPEKVD